MEILLTMSARGAPGVTVVYMREEYPTTQDPLLPEEGGLHGEIIDTPESRAWFQRLSEIAKGPLVEVTDEELDAL